MFKTTPAQTPDEYINMLEEPRKSDIQELDTLIRKYAPNLDPHIMSGMLAYGHYHYKGKTREGEWFNIGLASNKHYISLYVMAADKATGGHIAENYKDRCRRQISGSPACGSSACLTSTETRSRS